MVKTPTSVVSWCSTMYEDYRGVTLGISGRMLAVNTLMSMVGLRTSLSAGSRLTPRFP